MGKALGGGSRPDGETANREDNREKTGREVNVKLVETEI